jgi:exopolysaccharide/PEP-CTERM locus tyrosine autokinase
VSLVEQTIARLKRRHEPGTAPRRELGRAPLLDNRSPHGGPPVPPVDLEDTASLSRQITVDNTALRAKGYFPEQEKDRQFADQYRRIKRPLVEKAIAGTAAVGEPRVIMVTSALPGDGKTFTSINLALSMALERDMSVLLIDADVPKRHVTDLFGLGEQIGLLDVLVDDSVEIESAIVPTTTRGLSILPAGKPVAGTSELLSSSRMRTIIANFSARYPRRILLLDSSPLLVANEGRSLLSMAGQVVLVVRAGRTPKEAVEAALDLLDARQAGGVVLNHVQGFAEDYYAYGSYGPDVVAPT